MKRWMRGLRRTGLVLAGLLVSTGAFLIRDLNADVSHPRAVEFDRHDGPAPATGDWEQSRGNASHTGYSPFTPSGGLRTRWVFGQRVLIEFPPIVAAGRVFLHRFDGQTFALDARSGRVIWQTRVGSLSASSPAYSHGRLFVTSLSKRMVALDADDGHVLWQKRLGSRSESSPTVNGGTVYFGTEGNVLHAVRARDGKTRWLTRLEGPIKSSPALSRGHLYVGDYAGRMYSISASTGRVLWSNETSGAWMGLTNGAFYSTPAVAYGRVYAGNTDGKVYAFGARSGRIAWSHSTGDHVYSSPALVTARRHGPTVLIGSKDGRLYSFDARDGHTQWTHRGGGKVVGSPTVIGSTAYYSDTEEKRTYGIDVNSGTEVFRRQRGAYSPIVTDGKWLYLTGWASVTALAPAGR